MRIVCHSVVDFIENLRGRQVFDHCVYVNRTRRPLGGGREPTSWAVDIQVSAVVELDGGQALVQGAEECGVDRATADGGEEGTLKQSKLMGMIVSYCAVNEIALRPGVVDQ